MTCICMHVPSSKDSTHMLIMGVIKVLPSYPDGHHIYLNDHERAAVGLDRQVRLGRGSLDAIWK